ncbi:hypothetical protein T492DRAFT_1065794 [Pavlovales sp. CCMP2436]|nr:hypothetical protein T492DRAFT_1065794 [Pavlovales sp. CCMP2436]
MGAKSAQKSARPRPPAGASRARGRGPTLALALAVAAAIGACLVTRGWSRNGLAREERGRTETYSPACGAHLARSATPRLQDLVHLSGLDVIAYDPSAEALAEQLLAPVALDAFFAECLYRATEPRALHITRAGAVGHFSQLLDLDLVERVVARGVTVRSPEVRPPRNHLDISLLTRVLMDGEMKTGKYGQPDVALGVEEVWAKFGEGFTILINDVDQRDGRVAALCESLEAELRLPVNANFYATVEGTQGFEAHFDQMDVLVLQLEGEKEWTVYDPFLPLPDTERKFAPSAALLASVPSVQVTLTPGSLLFLPRGFAHEAATSNGSQHSSHLTLGILSKDALWLGLVHAAINVAAGQRAAAAAGSPDRQLSGGLSWAQLLRAASSAVAWSSAERALELREILPLRGNGWVSAPATAERLGEMLRLVASGSGLELSSSAFAWSEAAASSEGGRGDPSILRPRLSTWSASRLSEAQLRALDAELRARLAALAADAPALAAPAARGIEVVHAERVRVRRSARRRYLERHYQPPPGT